MFYVFKVVLVLLHKNSGKEFFNGLKKWAGVEEI